MKNVLKNNVFYYAYKDIVNFFSFRNQIKREKSNPQSKFNLLGLKTNWLGNCVYTQKVLSETQVLGDEKQRYIFLMDSTRRENSYFMQDLGWGEYLTFDLFNIVDEDTEIPTDTYAVVWKFTPFALGSSKLFWSTVLLVTSGIAIAAGLFKYGIL